MSILSIKNLSIGTNVAQPDYARLLSAGFARTARDFGIEFNPHFPDFVCAMGFTNGVLFQSWHPDEVARLTGKLESSPSLPSLELPQAAASLAEAFPGGPVDSGDLQRVLARLVYIGIETPKCDDELPGPLGRAILLGLRLAALQPALAECIVTRLKRTPYEPAFLVSRLSAWSAYDDLPFAVPIVEFASVFYRNRPHERDLVCGGLYDAWLIARCRPDAWDLSAWVYHGFARGQRLGLRDQKEARAVIEEVPTDELSGTLRIYRKTAVESEGNGGTFDILGATLRYFDSAHEGLLGRYYRERIYFRLQVLKAYDYAVWAGLLGAVPMDLSRLGGASGKEVAR